jgi:hypothetical protein
VGTLTSSIVQVFEKKRELKRINLPDFEQNPAIGELISSRLASFNKPFLISIEIQYSTNGTTTNGTWLKVPIGTQPLHDIINDVGNDDPLFDIDNATAIPCKYLRFKVTLRDNETPI